MDYQIAGKRALVLGASRGLGAAIARALAAEGVTVLAAARNVDGIKPESGLVPLTVDLADAASVQSLIETVRSDGGVDILVNNSGGPKPGPAQGQATADWLASFQSMATSLFAITDAMLPGMIEKQWGRIITVGSSGVVQPIPNLALSNGVRGAIAGWSKTLAGEVAKHGVTVNMVLPGRIDTDRIRQLDGARAERSGASIEAIQDASRAEIPAGRYGQPDEFAAAVVFLASKQAGYITGTMLPIDGGLVRGL